MQDLRAKIQQQAGDALLVAVSKGHSATDILTLYYQGQRHFAENYLQEAIPKIEALAEYDITWHFIGHLQSNKINKIVRYFDWVQGVADGEIAKKLNDAFRRLGRHLNICISVNIDKEPQKSGVFPEKLPQLAKEIKTRDHLMLRGLMVIPKPRDTADEQRIVFKEAKRLFDDLNERGFNLDTLSMGMSDDYLVALDVGSTMIRLGRTLFGESV